MSKLLQKISLLAVLYSTFSLLALNAHAATIKIGLMAPLTGAFASEGQDMQKVVEVQTEAINKAGGIKGNLIELVVEDDGSIPRTAANAANRLVANDVKYVIGTYGSAITEASQDIYDEAGAIQIATGATSIRLTSKGLEHFFRTCPKDDEQGRVAASTLKVLGFKQVALLHDNSAYGKGLAEEIIRSLKENSGPAIIFYDALQPNERDYTAILTKIKGTTPDAIMFTGYYPEAGMLLRQLAEMKWSIPLIGGDAANNIDLVKIAGVQAAKGYRFISPFMPKDLKSTDSQKFLADFRAKYGADPTSIWSLTAGDAFTSFVQAIETQGDDPQAISNYLHHIKNIEGLTGTLGFDEKGDRVGELYHLYEVDDSGNFILQ